MTKKIIIVGCGDIGSRHLQALTKSNFPIEVSVVEPKLEAIKIAKKRLKEVKSNDITIKWFDALSKVEDNFDLTIVSTTAKNRANLIIKLIEKDHRNFLIEKVVCQSTKEYESLIKETNSKKCKTWINLGRRYFPAYQSIRLIFKDSSKLTMSVTGGNFGLATNALHYIDTFSWLSKSNKVKLDGKLLYHEILPNKRGIDFVEFAGIIAGRTERCTFTLNDFDVNGIPQIVTISDGTKEIILNETEGQTLFINNNKQIPFKLDIASNLNTRIVDDILEDNDCILPTLKDTKAAHCELFRIFNQHLENITDKKVLSCPIT